ncbi:hypothetical protein [Streptomyces abikoensis]|uniref:hypothetical protein n=1 Tax=Streptomyces abikoensis TaxID=97398 RepID=UPI0033C974DB
MHGDGGLAQARLPADHGDRRSGGVEVIGQGEQPLQGGATGGEVGKVAGQGERVMRGAPRGGFRLRRGVRFLGGPGGGTGAAQTRGVFQFLRACGVQP